MNDPFGSMNGFMNQFRGFMQNPMQFMMQRKLNIPQNMMSNPNAAIQQLMNSGQMTQAQYNQLKQMSKQIMNNPQFAQFMQMFGRQ